MIFFRWEDNDMNLQMSGAQMGAVVLTGLAVVFFVILLLILIIWFMGKVIPAISDMLNGKGKTTEIAESKSVPKPMPTQSTPKLVPSQDIAQTDDDEIIAVISSAVAMMSLADGKNYRVKSVKAIKGNTSGRPAWSMAGLRENTRPFKH